MASKQQQQAKPAKQPKHAAADDDDKDDGGAAAPNEVEMEKANDAATGLAGDASAAGGEGDEQKELPRFSLDILANIKAAQQQNGLRHGDYQRYRGYCSRRLRRLRVGLDFTNPKRDFKLRPLEPAVVTDVRHLTLALVQAERAWAYAMQLKNDMTAETQRKRCHLLKRLGKAATWSALLEKLCAARADTRTQLQAEAYAAWLAGSVQFERNQHDKALAGFLHAKQVYEKLGSIGGASMQLLCEERVASLQDSIRFSKYMQRHAKGGAAGDDEDMSDLASSSNELLAAKLETLRQEKLAEQAQSLDTIQWQGKTVPVSNDKLRMSFVEANNLRAQLDKALENAHKQGTKQAAAPAGKKGAASAGSSADAAAEEEEEEPTNVQQLFQRLFSSYDDAIKVLRDALLEPQMLESHKAHLLALRDYATQQRVTVQLQRNRNFAANVVATLRDQEERPAAYAQRKLHKPDEVVLLYEKIAANVQELLDLATANKNAASVRLLTAQLASARALRVFYLAESYRRVRKFLEAFLLYSRAIELADEFDKLAAKDTAAPEIASEAARIEEVRRDAQGRRGQVHAQALLEQAEQKAAGVAPSGDAAAAAGKDKPSKAKSAASLPLAQRLDNWDAGLPSEQHALLEFPPSFQAAPAKPILFDLAFNAAKVKQPQPASAPKKIAPPGESKADRAERERRAREEEEKRIAAEEAAKKKQGWGFGGLLGKMIGR